MKKILILFSALTLIVVSCDVAPPVVNPNAQTKSAGLTPLTKYSGDLAVKWNRLEMAVIRSTAGVNGARAFAYSGLALYEAMVKGIPGRPAVASKLIGHDITKRPQFPVIYWPASGNAAMAYAIRHLIPTASAANAAKIDSLEQAFNNQFKTEVSQTVLDNSIAYGQQIADEIFVWGSTDGAAEAGAKNNDYVVPTGLGLWEPTPPGFVAHPVNAFAKDIRPFLKDSPTLLLAAPPIPYSEDPNSEYYQQVKYVYDYSLHLTADEINIVKTWGEFPGNYTQQLRYIQLGIQLIDEADLPLDEAATAFAMHHMALVDAITCVFVSKYTYNYMRPITFIRNVLGHTDWVTVNTTPPHPEYPSAHASAGRASSRIMEKVFGTNYAITDNTHAGTWGARNYASPEAYSDEAAWSRVLGGIHYVPSAAAGKHMGEQVGDMIYDLFTYGN